MSLAGLLLPLVATLGAAPSVSAEGLAEGLSVRWEAPQSYLAGLAYEVTLELEAPEGGAVVESWMLSPAAFTVDGKPLGKREKGGQVHLPAGFTLSGRIDLGPQLKAEKDFTLGLAKELGQEGTTSVSVLHRAPEGLDFMTLPAEQLGGYRVLLRTNRGDIQVKLWPDVAPQHVRNFLDLSYTGFYDGTKFHRAIEGFMIQGGDPTGTGTGSGPRTLPLEPSDRPHVRGVLSMARANDPNSATCQFFIMHGNARQLDSQYSAFGEVVTGMATVDTIVAAPKRRNSSGEMAAPIEPQILERALVILAPDAPQSEDK